MFVQYSASVTHPTHPENAHPSPVRPFKEAITLFCKRFQPSLPQEALFWFSSAASDTLEYLQEQLRILQNLDSKGVLQLYMDEIPPALRTHDEDFVRHLTSLLVGAGAACNVSVVDTRIVIGMTLPQDTGKKLGGCGDMGFDWVETFERPKDYEAEKSLKSKSDREEIRNRGCLNQPTLSFEQRLISWTGGLV